MHCLTLKLREKIGVLARAAYMSLSRDTTRFTVSEVAADWQELTISAGHPLAAKTTVASRRTCTVVLKKCNYTEGYVSAFEWEIHFLR